MKHINTYNIFESLTKTELGEALIEAGYLGDMKKLNKLLLKGADINFKDSLGKTILMNASINNMYDIVRFAINRGADINIRCNPGSTALIFAANAGILNIVQLLLDSGADPTIKSGRYTFIENAAPNIVEEYLSKYHIQKKLLDKYPELFKNFKKIGIVHPDITNDPKYSHLDAGYDLNLL